MRETTDSQTVQSRQSQDKQQSQSQNWRQGPPQSQHSSERFDDEFDYNLLRGIEEPYHIDRHRDSSNNEADNRPFRSDNNGHNRPINGDSASKEIILNFDEDNDNGRHNNHYNDPSYDNNHNHYPNEDRRERNFNNDNRNYNSNGRRFNDRGPYNFNRNNNNNIRDANYNFNNYNRPDFRENVKRIKLPGSVMDSIAQNTSLSLKILSVESLERKFTDALREYSISERNKRFNTVAFKTSTQFKHETIENLVGQEWKSKLSEKIETQWPDRYHQNIQLATREKRDQFIQLIHTKTNPLNQLETSLVKTPFEELHYSRKKVRLEISKVPLWINIQDIEEKIKSYVSAKGNMSEFKEGKPYRSVPDGMTRVVIWSVDAQAFEDIFDNMTSGLSFYNPADKQSRTLYPKIGCRPWSCRSCHFLGGGQHPPKCNKKSCSRCGDPRHMARDCSSHTTQCTNCNQEGHLATDIHCPIYFRETFKEIKRVDIPLSYLENGLKRFYLYKLLSYK